MAKKASRKSAGGARKAAAKRAAKRTKPTTRKGARKTARSAKKSARKSTRTSATRRSAKKAAPRKRVSAGGRARAAKKAARSGGRPRGGQLSQSTARARWIESPEDRGERPGETLATRSHEVIQKWAEERGAVPATVGEDTGERPHVLRFNFPGFGGESLREIGWEDWFATFDERDLVFIYQDRLKDGDQSNFFRLDNPNSEEA